jgi:hypothetical protein
VAAPHRYDAAFGYYTFAASLGQAVGPGLILLFGGARTIPHTGTIFGVTIAITVVLLGVTIALRPPAIDRPATEDGEPAGLRDLLRSDGSTPQTFWFIRTEQASARFWVMDQQGDPGDETSPCR